MITDKAVIFGENVDLHFLTSGHYCADIVPNFTSNRPSEEVHTYVRKYPLKWCKNCSNKKDSQTTWTCFNKKYAKINR